MKSITDFGAVGDGATDNFVALTRTFASDPGAVEIPPGLFYCSKTLVLPYDVTITGAGRLRSIVHFAPGQEGFVRIAKYGSIDVRHLAIQAGGNGTGMYLGGCTQCTIEDVAFNQSNAGIYLHEVSAVKVRGCFFLDFSGAAITVEAPDNPDGGDNWIAENYFINTGELSGKAIGISHVSGGGLKIYRNKILNVAHGYFGNLDLRGHACSALMIDGNSIEGFTVDGIAIRPQSGGALMHVTLNGNEGGGGSGSRFIVVDSGGRRWVNTMACNSNVVRNTSGAGAIVLDGVENFGVVGNVIGEAGTPTSPAVLIGPACRFGRVVGNSIVNYLGIHVDNQGQNVMVT